MCCLRALYDLVSEYAKFQLAILAKKNHFGKQNRIIFEKTALLYVNASFLSIFKFPKNYDQYLISNETLYALEYGYSTSLSMWDLKYLFYKRFSSITVNLGPTFLSGALAANSEEHLREPSCPLVQVHSSKLSSTQFSLAENQLSSREGSFLLAQVQRKTSCPHNQVYTQSCPLFQVHKSKLSFTVCPLIFASS